MIPPWMTWPRIEAKMYFPRLVTRSTISSISTILLPTRNIMPIGTYLCKWNIGCHQVQIRSLRKHNIFCPGDNILLKNLLLPLKQFLIHHTLMLGKFGGLFSKTLVWWMISSQILKGLFTYALRGKVSRKQKCCQELPGQDTSGEGREGRGKDQHHITGVEREVKELSLTHPETPSTSTESDH